MNLLKFFGFLSFTIFFSCGCYEITPCEIAPDHSVPWAPPCFEKRELPILSSASETEEEWQQHIGPWPIGELIDIALQNNPLTHQSWQIAKSYSYSWKASQSSLYPYVDASEQLLFQKISGTSAAGIINNSSIVVSDDEQNTSTTSSTTAGIGRGGDAYNRWLISTLSCSYLLFDFGGRSSFIESAKQALISANWNHNRTIQAVILNVLTDYYLHLEAKALFEAKEDDLKNAQENANAAQGQFSAGVKAKLDVLLAKSNLANTRLQLEQNRGEVKTSLGRLATSLGMPANAEFIVENLPKEVAFQNIHDSVEKLIEIAKLLRPDLSAAEADWRQAKENVIIAWSEGMPTLNANGNLQTASNIHRPAQNSRLYSGSLFLNIPIFTGFLYVNQTRSAQANADAAYAVWKDKEENVILDVVTSYYNFKTAEQTVKFSEEYYEYTEEAYDVAFASYKNGVGTILDLLSAQVALSNARAQKIQARTQWITSLTNVAYATGQL